MRPSDKYVEDGRPMIDQELAAENARLAVELDRLSSQDRRLLTLRESAKSCTSLSDLLLIVRNILIDDFGFDRAGVFSFDPVTETVHGIWGTDIKGDLEDLSYMSYGFGEAERRTWDEMRSGGKGFLLRHFEPQDERLHFPEEMAQVRDHAVVLMVAGEDLVGYVAVDNLITNRPIAESQIAELLPFIEQASLAVQYLGYKAEREALIQQQRRVMDIALTIASKEDPEMVYLMARNAIMEIGLVDRAAVFTVNDYVAHGTWGTDEHGDLQDEHHIQFGVEPGGKYFAPFDNRKQPFVIDTVNVRSQAGRAWLDVPHAYLPLRVGEDLIGIVTVDTLLTMRKITPQMLTPLLPIADQAAVAIQKSRLQADREKLVQQQRRLMEISVAITANENPDAVFRMVRDAVMETGLIDRAGVWLLDADGETLTGTWGTDEHGLLKDEHDMKLVIGQFLKNYSACLQGDDEFVINPDQTVVLGDGTHVPHIQYAVIPLKTSDNLMGILSVDTFITKRTLTQEKIEVILPLAKQAAVVVQNSRLLAAAQQEIARRRSAEELLKAHAEALTIARDEALAGTRAKSEFLANMSHEIRTPMNGVIGMTSMLSQTQLTADQQEYVHVIQECGNALLSVIEDILDVSRLEAGVLKIAREPFNMRDCIEDVAELMSSQMKTEFTVFNCHVPTTFPERLIGDAHRVRQIVTNLLGNAIKFTSQGDITVELSCLSESDESARVRIEVRDTGIGIPEDRQGSIFEVFTQVDGSSTRRHGGAGLGLTITKQIVELMGGSIGLESKPGEGSTFWIEIDFEKQAQAAALPFGRSAIIEGASVLLAIDNLTKQRIIGGYVESWGCKPVIVQTAKQASEAARLRSEDDDFDFVVLEFELSDMDGVVALEDLRTIPSTAKSPAFLLTSAHNRHKIDTSRFTDFAGVLVKPIRAGNLLKALERAKQGEVVVPAQTSEAAKVSLGLRILLAEDNVVNSMVATGRLTEWNCVCTLAENGVEALRAFETGTFDAILMDVSMPIMDGIQATQEIRSREKMTGARRMPIFALTAHALQGDRERCLDAGMDDYISKPVNFDELLAKLRRLNDTR